MDFAQVAALAEIGDAIVVSDGAPEPTPGTLAHANWASRNYAGSVAEVQEGAIIVAGNVSPPVKSRTHTARADAGLVFDLPGSLAAQKAGALSRLAARRWQAQCSMAYDGVSPVAYGADTSGNITATLTALAAQDVANPESAPHAITWKLGRGAFRTWTAAQLQAFGFAILAYMAACFTREGEISGEIEAAEDIEALAAIDIDAGWPVTGGGE